MFKSEIKTILKTW